MLDAKVAIWRFAGVEVNVRQRVVRIDGEQVGLEPRPFDLLLLLLEHAGSVVTTDEILETVWAGRVVSEVQVANVIGKIRKALRDEQQKIIVTSPRVGYRLVANVETTLEQKQLFHLALQPGTPVPGRPNWRLVSRIGSGGFGDVWLAEQDKTSTKRVYKFCQESRQLAALKREVTLFRLLRQTLGPDAPIATIRDWQFEETPYFIESDYAGPDLRSWFDARGGLETVPLEERLEIIVKVAEAVSATHNVGVLHKDLKPQNVLVSQLSGPCQVLLCDFGTARLFDQSKADQLGITVHGFTQTVAQTEASGTLVYMAPELLSGGRASAHSDVYALGIMLYQVVTGRWQTIAPGWEGEISDELLRDDIAQATHLQPQRRLPSPQLLAERLRTLPQRREQLQRQRADQQRLERAQKLLEKSRARRPWMIAAGAALLLGFAISTTELVQQRRTFKIAEHERNTALQLNSFLNDVIKAASPDYGGHYDIPLKTAIHAALPKVSERLQAAPQIEASIDQALAETLYSLSEPVEAQKLAARAASLYGNVYGTTDLRTLSAHVDEAAYGLVTEDAGSVSTQFDPTMRALARALPPGDPLMLKARYVEAKLSTKQGKVDDAIKQLEALLSNFPASAAGELGLTLDYSRVLYARNLVGRRDGVRAQQLVTSWLPHFVATYGEQGRPTVELHQSLSQAYADWGVSMPGDQHFDEAVAEGRKAVDGFTALYGADGMETLNSQQLLGDVYLSYDRYDLAIPLYEAAYSGLARHYGPTSEWTLRPLLRIVQCQVDDGHADRALPRVRDLLQLAHKNLKPTDYLYRHVLMFSAQAFLSAGAIDEGSPLVDQYEQLAAQVKPDSSNKSSDAYLLYLKGIRAQQLRQPEAASLLRAAVPALSEAEGPDDVTTRDAKARLDAIEHRGSPEPGTGSSNADRRRQA